MIEKENRGPGIWIDFFRFAIITLIIVLPIRIFIAQPFIVSGASMDPTFENGEYLIVDEISYRFSDPKRGEVVIFKFPFEPKKFLIKRVIALPNERISIENETVTIYNKDKPQGFVLKEPYIVHHKIDGKMEFSLASDEYFVMGDNRPASADSRSWGMLKREYVVGKPFIRLLPISRLEIT